MASTSMLPNIKTTMKQFFDREAVMAKMPAVKRKVLRESGAYVMTTARRLIKGTASKRSKAHQQFAEGKITAVQRDKRLTNISKPSPAGSPPKSRTGLLKDHIYFAYDDATGHVIVGPAKLGGTRISPTTPQLLEEGGEFDGTKLEGTGEWTTVDGEPRQYLKTVRVKKYMPQRAYMGEPSGAMSKPAVKTKLAKIWADSLKA